MPPTHRFRPIQGGARPEDRLDDLQAVVDDYLKPAVDGLELAVADADLEAVRAYAHELIVGAGSVIAACPRPSPRARR